MSDSAEKDARFVAGIVRSQRPFLVTGIVLALAGAAYLTWAIARYEPWLDPRDDPGFDRPVAQLAFLFQKYQLALEARVQEGAATRSETRLMRRMSQNMQFSAGIMVLMLRLFIGTIVLVFGLSIMTVVVERARLLAVIGRLRE